jgi:hypothetical protein
LIPYYTLLHAKTKACPQGRIVEFLDDKTWILDTALPYDDISVYPYYADKQPLHNFGCTVMSSLVGLQKAYDAGMTVIATNQQSFGVQSIAVDHSSNVKPSQVTDGINWIKTNLQNGVPEAISLCKTPAEIFSQLDRIEAQMEKLSGLPSILRGTPPTGVTSGTAMAYLQAQALVFNSPLQQSYISLIERVATGIINTLKTYANTKRIATIVGASKKSYVVDFTGQDLEGIERVTVQVGNPAMDTAAGKIQVADSLLQKGMVTTPQEYIAVLRTGDLDTMTDATEKELILIRQENEFLVDGNPVIADPNDNHPLHIREHQCVLMDPEIRMRAAQGDPQAMQILQSTRVHQNNHLMMLQGQANPAMLAVLGVPPLPAPQPTSAPGTNVATPLPQNAPVGAQPHAPVLPHNTPGPVANAAAQSNNGPTKPHLPGAK